MFFGYIMNIYSLDLNTIVSCKPMLDNAIDGSVSFLCFDSTETLIAICMGNVVKIAFCSTGDLFIKLEGHLQNVTMCKFNTHKSHEIII